MANTDISIVLGTYNRNRFLRATIESIREELAGTACRTELIVIDGGSTDGSTEWLARQKDIITIVQHNRGQWKGQPLVRRSWGYFMNLGFKCAQGRFVCMLSDDCLVVPGAIRNGHDLFEKELARGRNVGAVAFYFRDNPASGHAYYVSTTFDRLFANHGLFLRAAVADVGYFDEERYRFYHADTDLCLRLWQKGYVVIDSPDSYIEHFVHSTMRIRRLNDEGEPECLRNFLAAWQGVYYDPNKPVLGGKIERRFVDTTGTLRKYLKRLPVGFRLAYALEQAGARRPLLGALARLATRGRA